MKELEDFKRAQCQVFLGKAKGILLLNLFDVGPSLCKRHEVSPLRSTKLPYYFKRETLKIKVIKCPPKSSHQGDINKKPNEPSYQKRCSTHASIDVHFWTSRGRQHLEYQFVQVDGGNSDMTLSVEFLINETSTSVFSSQLARRNCY